MTFSTIALKMATERLTPLCRHISVSCKLYRDLRFLWLCCGYCSSEQPTPFGHLLWVVRLRPFAPPSVLRAEKTYPQLACQCQRIAVQFTAYQQIDISHLVVLLNISQMTLSPYTDFHLLFIREGNARNIIIALQFVPQTILSVINSVFHYVILQNIDFPTILINPADYKAEGRSYFLT